MVSIVASIISAPVIYLAVGHFQFKGHVMNVLDKNPNTISNYLQARNVLESDDYLGRPLKGGEKKRLSKYLLRMNPVTENAAIDVDLQPCGSKGPQGHRRISARSTKMRPPSRSNEPLRAHI